MSKIEELVRIECGRCEGTGKLDGYANGPESGVTGTADCSTCHGTGKKFWRLWQKCHHCSGDECGDKGCTGCLPIPKEAQLGALVRHWRERRDAGDLGILALELAEVLLGNDDPEEVMAKALLEVSDGG